MQSKYRALNILESPDAVADVTELLDKLDAITEELAICKEFYKRLLNPLHSIGTDEFEKLLAEAMDMTTK